MKTFFTFLLGTIFSTMVFAEHGTRLSIATLSNNEMKVEIDGHRYKMNSNGINVRDLHPGYHTIKIYREGKKNNRWWDFGRSNNRQQVVYNNKIYLRNGYHTDILINRFGKVFFDERRIENNDDWYDENDDDWNGNDRDRDNQDRDNRDYRDDDNNNYKRAMSDQDFNRAKETLRKEWIEYNRVTSAKQIIDANRFRSQQVKELIQLFTFENNKLEMAKYAYRNTVDRNNYYIVNDVFTFNSSKEELNKYIREFR